MRGNSCSIRIGIALFRGNVCSIRIGIALMRRNSCSIRMGLALGSGNSCGIRMGIAEFARIIHCVTWRSVLIRKFPCSIPMACVFIRQGCVKSVSLAPKQTPSPRHGQRPSGARATVWRVSLCTGKTPEHTKGRSERKIFRNASSCQLLLAVATCRKSRAKHVHFIKEMTWNSGP